MEKSYVKRAVEIAWPSVLESFFVALTGLIDSFMVSTLGAYAVAAVGLTTQPKFIGLAVFIAVNVAVSALVARRKGEGRKKSANEILMTAAVFTLIAGMIVSTVCVVWADDIIRLSGSEADTHASAVEYFRIIMGCMLFNIISLVINAAQRGAGNTKIAMKTNVTSNLINLVGNYLLIGGHFGFPALGIRGAAIATMAGTMAACVMSILSICKKENFISIFYMKENQLRPGMEPVRSIFKISSSVFLEQILLRIGFMSVALMAAKLGTDAFAAHQLGMNIMSLSFSFGDGMQVAAVALIGQSLGQHKIELAKTYGRICQRIGNVISIVLSVTYLLIGRGIYELYFEEAHIVDMGVSIMRVMVLIVVLQISQVIYMGCLRGAGDVVFTTIASTISVTLIRPMASYLFCYILNFGVIGLWLGVLSDQICRFILTNIRFRSGKWTGISV